MDEIICVIDMFSLIQEVKLPNGNNSYIITKELYKILPDMCAANKIYKIHFLGNEEYINGIVKDIKNFIKLNYSNDRIEIEVN